MIDGVKVISETKPKTMVNGDVYNLIKSGDFNHDDADSCFNRSLIGDERIAWLKAAADFGHLPAIKMLMEYYKNDKDNYNWYKSLAFDIGICDTDALSYYIDLFDKGHYQYAYLIGIINNSLEYLEIASNNGLALASFQVGEYYRKLNKGNALKYYKRAADNFHIKSLEHVISYYLERGQFNNAEPYIKLGLQLNNSYAKYARGKELLPSFEAIEYLTIAADEGIPEAMCEVAEYYYNSAYDKDSVSCLNIAQKYIEMAEKTGYKNTAIYKMDFLKSREVNTSYGDPHTIFNLMLKCVNSEQAIRKLMNYCDKHSMLDEFEQTAIMLPHNDAINELIVFFIKMLLNTYASTMSEEFYKKVTGKISEYCQISADYTSSTYKYIGLYYMYEPLHFSGVLHDKSLIEYNITKAINLGSKKAAYEYAMYLATTTKDTDRINKYFNIAVERKSQWGTVLYATYLFENGNITKGTEIYNIAKAFYPNHCTYNLDKLVKKYNIV
jgi:TPR repeat protein